MNTSLLGPENDASWCTGNSLHFNLDGGYICLLMLNQSLIFSILVVLCAFYLVSVNPKRKRERDRGGARGIGGGGGRGKERKRKE